MGDCFSYGGRTYRKNVLFEKIRSKADFFAKKHAITGFDVEVALGTMKDTTGNVEFHFGALDTPILPKTLIAKVAKVTKDKAADIIRDSEWYQKLSALDQTQVDDQLEDVYAYVKTEIGRHKANQIEKNKKSFDDVASQVTKMKNEGKTDSEILDEFTNERDRDFATRALNIIENDNLTNKEAYDKHQKALAEEKAALDRLKAEEKKTFREKVQSFTEKWIDRQYLPKKWLDAIGAGSVTDRLVAFAGASSKAKHDFDLLDKKIYKGLNKKELADLDSIIQLRRIIAIDNNRAERGIEPIKHSNGQNAEQARKALEYFKERLGDKKYNDMVKRADVYFGAFKTILAKMRDNGLINEETYDTLAEIDYQPRLFLMTILDVEGEFSNGKEDDITFREQNAGLGKDQIQALKDGSYEPSLSDSRKILASALISRHKAMAMNEVNKKLMEDEYPKQLARYEQLAARDFDKLNKEDKRFFKYFKDFKSKVIPNPIIGANIDGSPKYKYDKLPDNDKFKKAYYYVDGVRHEIFMSKDIHEKWYDTAIGVLTDGKKSKIARYSGSNLLKQAATGNNPLFAFANTPRDFFQVLAFSTAYNNNVGLNFFRLIGDTAKAGISISKYDKGLDSIANKYFEYGGGMDFLHQQGVFQEDGFVKKYWGAFVDSKGFKIGTLKAMSRYSEVVFRVAVFDRSVKKQLKEMKVDDVNSLTKDQQDDVYFRAVNDARSILDFNQGGTHAKDMESVVPYFNAAIQGTRVAIDAFNKNPQDTTFRLLQMATYGALSTIGASLLLISAFKDDDDEEKGKSAMEIYLEAIEGLSPYARKGRFNIWIGKNKETGENEFISISKTQALAPMFAFTEGVIEDMMRKHIGAKQKGFKYVLRQTGEAFTDYLDPTGLSEIITGKGNILDRLTKSVQGTMSKNPLIKGVMTYATGYDFFRGEDLIDTRNTQIPESRQGANSKSVADFYKKLGESTGISPVKTQAMVESFVTSPGTNPFVAVFYGIGDVVSTDKSFIDTAAKFRDDLGKSALKRVYTETTSYARMLNKDALIAEKLSGLNSSDYDLKKVIPNEIYSKYKGKQLTSADLASIKTDINKAVYGTAKAPAKPTPEQLRQFGILAKVVINKIEQPDIRSEVWRVKFEGQTDQAKAFLIHEYFGDIRKDPKLAVELKAAGLTTDAIMIEYIKLLSGQ